jgi:hypothetical protein
VQIKFEIVVARHFVVLAAFFVQSHPLDLGQSERKFGHDLTKLWEATRPVLAKFVEEDWLTPVGDAVEVFNAVDRQADAFRYATNPDGDPQMPKNTYVVYHELIGQMDDVHAAIELVLTEISREEGKMERAIEEAVARDPF